MAAGSEMGPDSGVDKLMDTHQEQDANEKEGQDHTREDLAREPNFSGDLPSISSLHPVVRELSTLVSEAQNQSTGESGESNGKNETDNKDSCGVSSIGRIPVVSGSHNDHVTSEDSQSSLVIGRNSVDMEENHGLDSATDEAPATFVSMPLSVGGSKSESIRHEEDKKIIDSARSLNVDEFPASDNLLEESTDDVGSQIEVVPISSMVSGHSSIVPEAFSSVDEPGPGTVPTSSSQVRTENTAEQVPDGRLHSIIDFKFFDADAISIF